MTVPETHLHMSSQWVRGLRARVSVFSSYDTVLNPKQKTVHFDKHWDSELRAKVRMQAEEIVCNHFILISCIPNIA